MSWVSARLTTFEHDGLIFDVDDGGPVSGPPLLLLHGFPQDHTCWDAVAAPLHDAGYRTLAPDLRGYSPRARPPGRRAYTVGASAADCLALLDAAGVQTAHVVGHDWGGAVAWVLAGRQPRRVATLTVLSTPHPAAMAGSLVRSTQGLRSWYMAFFQLPWVPERLVALQLADTLRRSGLPAARAQHYAARMREPDALRAALGWYRAMPFSLAESTPPSPVPTTYLWGQHDFALGRSAAEATLRHVTGEYRFIELDAGHWLPETRPQDVAEAVRERVAAASG